MGLTIHYSFRTDVASTSQARDIITRLRERAMDLPLEAVGPMIELTGDGCARKRRVQGDPLGWLLCQAGAWIEVGGASYSVPPSHMIAFTTSPGHGSEQANFGLCCYPATFEVREAAVGRRAKRVATHLEGWRWGSFCKTQYASNSACGGVKNFLRCHVAVVTLLDHAKELGILHEVNDEGEYWVKRDIAELAREVGHWNQFIAGLAGELKDQLGSHVLAAIAQFPDFEDLGAKGRSTATRAS